MPKRKPSERSIMIASPFETFIEWFRNEVDNMAQWNPAIGHWQTRTRYQFANGSWIHFMRRFVVVECDEPVLYIRKGLAVNMGHGRIEIS